MRLLVVEDSPVLREAVVKGLEEEGFAVDAAPDGEVALSLLGRYDYDAIVLDLMLPKVDGLSVLERLRATGSATNVIVLTARDTTEDRITGFRKGADDYLTKPFAFEELLYRVRALVRRRYPAGARDLVFGELTVDAVGGKVLWRGEPVGLTAREYRVLEYLAFRAGEVVSRMDIEDHVYSERNFPMSNAVDSTICTLRAKLKKAGCPPVIRTRHGRGYVLEARAS